jgi:hypothetical protein
VAVAAKAEDLLGAVGDDGRGEVTCSRRRVWPSSATAVVVGLAAMIFPHCRIGLFICGEHGRRSFHDLCSHDPAFLVLLRCAAGSVFLRTVAATFQPPAADLSTLSLPKPLEVP